jgi:uncharacterized protein (DUF302 family)
LRIYQARDGRAENRFTFDPRQRKTPKPCYCSWSLIGNLKIFVMAYHFSRKVNVSFDEAVARTIEALKAEGFGVLTDIDVSATLKLKLGEDFRAYRILGACNPPLAFSALQLEDKIGTMLPCNVIVQDHPGEGVEISAVDPVASMQAIENPGLAEVAKQVQAKLRRVIDNL